MKLEPRENKTEILSKKELLIGLYNEQHDQLIRFTVDERVLQRVLVAGFMPTGEVQKQLGQAQTLVKIKKENLNVIMDEIMELEDEESKVENTDGKV